LAAATRRSIGRSWPAAAADCEHGLTGNTHELDELIDKQADVLSEVTAGEDNFLSLRGPLSCCTAARAETDIIRYITYVRISII